MPLAALGVPPILTPLYPAVVFHGVDRTGTTNRSLCEHCDLL